MLKDIEYIYAVYQERSFSKAARRLFISQPSLSAAVKRIENELGLPLFNRSTNPVSLTEAGEYYINFADKIMETEREMQEHFAALAGGAPARLNVGSSMFFCSYVLPEIIEAFRARYANITATLSEGSSVALSERLREGALDFLLEAEQLDKNVFESVPWTAERIVLAVPASNPINEELSEFRYSFEEMAAESTDAPLKPAVPLGALRGRGVPDTEKMERHPPAQPRDLQGSRFYAEGIDVSRTDDDGLLPCLRRQGHRLCA